MNESKQPSRKHRYAFEWYVNEQDEWYWRRAVRRMQRITALAVAGVVIGGVALFVTYFDCALIVAITVSLTLFTALTRESFNSSSAEDW